MGIDMKTIASKAGVSVATVSRTLNRPEMVRPATREKVLAVVRSLGYSPNPFAQGLATGKTKLIALVVPTLNNSFFGQLAEGCQKFLIPNGYNLVIFISEDYAEKERSLIGNLDQRRIDGLILSGSGFLPHDYPYILEQIKIPTVLVEHLPTDPRFTSVYIDDQAGATMAVQYLINRGHRRIGVIAGHPSMLATTRRLRAVKSILQEHNLPFTKGQIVYGDYASLESGACAMDALIKSSTRPTAVFAFNDVLAIGALKAAQRAGLRVPEDVAIIGFDDIPVAAYCSPGLSTIHSPSLELGRQAAKLLLERLGQDNVPVKKVLLPVELVLRESC
ncbi:LacI family DNA-binding transcriptional regulator [Moorellaceae bacterium AZ2]